MSWFWYILAALWILQGLRLRKLLKSIPVLEPAAGPVSSIHRFITADGIQLDDATRSAAIAHASAEGLEFLDLVPADIPAIEALRLVQRIDPKSYRDNRIGSGQTAGCAMLATAELLQRTAVSEGTETPAAMFRLARKFKRYAVERSDMAVAPGLKSPSWDYFENWPVHSARSRSSADAVLRLRATVLALMVGGVFLAPIAGATALFAYHLQILMAFAGLPLRPRDFPLAFLLRSPLEIWGLARVLLGRRRESASEPDPFEARRPFYQALLSQGLGHFFEPRREDCPLCGSRSLAVWLRTGDMLQSKPGKFILDRCRGCGHIFQNPRLSPAGLEFYYGDCYEGLGSDLVERMFELAPDLYRRRALAVESLMKPARWLDVGTGHAHFCCAAKSVWPETQFDGVDLGEAIQEAERAGWVGRAYAGFLPDVAAQMACRYDVISYYHCLEHTAEPRAEIAAARVALAPAGLLVIEVPDPECPMGRWLGRFWFPWLQPQHLHLLSRKNLRKLLREEGFEPVLTIDRDAHLGGDVLLAFMILYRKLGPIPNLPWRARATWISKARYAVVWNAGYPLLLLGWFLNAALNKTLRSLGASNSYGIVARRLAAEPDPPRAAVAGAKANAPETAGVAVETLKGG